LILCSQKFYIYGFNQLQIENIWEIIMTILHIYRFFLSFPKQYSIKSIYIALATVSI
jgi:hypothetical protein